jgi:hypothetical protein
MELLPVKYFVVNVIKLWLEKLLLFGKHTVTVVMSAALKIVDLAIAGTPLYNVTLSKIMLWDIFDSGYFCQKELLS